MSARKRKHPSEDEDSGNGDEEMEWSDDEGTRIDGIYIPPPIKPITSHKFATRLLITKITNKFFKSYANEVVLGPFSKCFNAIVGPNGSGKSNVIDSMLFVFGYRAAKIRSKKLSVLLHNSDKFRNVQSCTVCVHFCEIIDKEGDDYDLVPDSEFTVSRTANKDNSSYYEINNKKVQFKEVAQLLRKHGIDLDHNRFLILQGEVEEIAMMKCKGSTENETGMLEYLEDVIGTSRYKSALAQLSERIETLSVLRSEKLNRVKLVEKELEELKEPMEEAVHFLKTENKAIVCRNVIFQRKIFTLEDSTKEMREEMATVTENLNKLNERLENIAKQKAEKEAILHEASTHYNKLQARKDKLKESYNNAIKQDDQLQADIAQLVKNRKKCKTQLEEEKRKLEQFNRIPEENKQKIEEYEAKELELNNKIKALEIERAESVASVREETLELQNAKERLESQLEHLRKPVDETRSAYNLAEGELKLAVRKEETEKNKLEQLNKSITERQEIITQNTEQVAQLRKKIPLTEKSLNGALEEVNKVKREEAQLLAELSRKKRDLEDKKSTMQSVKSRGRVLDALMEQKRKGNCPGLYGRLGDLGAIDEKYDVAISTGCGLLDYIVVDTVDTAEWCIDFLKRRDTGRANFIALDKQEHLRDQAESRIRTPENVHRLYDLVQIQDEDVKTAFYYALRDTLVADDLEQGGRIAYGAQRFRVVTLNGEIIEMTGTMTGGGRQVTRGKMGRKRTSGAMVNPKDIEKMQIEVDEFNHRLRTIADAQSQLDKQIVVLEPELNTMKSNLGKLLRELKAAEEELPMLKKQLKQQEVVAKSTKSDAQQVKKLTKIVEDTKAKYEQASGAAEEIQVKVDEIKNDIKIKTDAKMKGVNKQLSEVTKTLEKLRTDIVKFRVAITSSERNSKKSQAKIADLEENITDAENRLKRMAAQREEIESDTKKLLERVEQMAAELIQEEEQFAGMKKEVATFVKEKTAIDFEKVDVEQAFKTLNEKLQESNASIHQWHAKLQQLQLHDIPNEPREELAKFTEEDIKSKNLEATELELNAAETFIRSAKPNLNVLNDYRKGHKVFVERSKELDQVTEKRNEMKGIYDKVKTQRKDEFMVGYNTIRVKLKEMYQMITLGGDADFEIVDSFDPFSEGIQFNVRPPKKSWKIISNLSGGEKTLSSLALVFALHYYKPSPLYVMDEIDAALDFKNVSIVGNYIKERTKNAQFIIISLRSNMFELCDNLIGIYKIFNCTQSIAINPAGFAKKQENPEKQIFPVAAKSQGVQQVVTVDVHQSAGPSSRRSSIPDVLVPSSDTSHTGDSDDIEIDEDGVVEDSLLGSQ